MMCNTDRLIQIIEDHTSMETGYRMILEAIETRELPKESSLPCFNDEMVSDNLVEILEKVTGKKY